MSIKNFKAPSYPKKVLAKKILVSDYMTPRSKLITFSLNLKVVEAMQIFVKKNISGAPVVDENNQLVGMISEGDCMEKVANSKYYSIPLHDQTVEEYMTTDVGTIKGDTNIFDVAHLFCTASRNRFPVMEDNKIIGQISRKDILKAALEIK